MAEFTLPKNSKIGKGRHFKAPAEARRVRSFKVRSEADSVKRKELFDKFHECSGIS